jgi:uroporphyrinogen-III synthase
MLADGILAGRSALLLRSADRSASTVAELRARGAHTVLCPLIDFEHPPDTAALDAGLRRLLEGGFDWLVLTSITTVRALKQRAAALGLELALPAATRLAVVGDATARAATAEGMRVDFMPEHDHSAEGIFAGWRTAAGEPPQAAGGEPPPAGDSPHAGAGPRGGIFLPQADIAAPRLNDGLAARGWDTCVAVAYRTVDAPADPSLRLTTALAIGTSPGDETTSCAPVLNAGQLVAAHGAPEAVQAVLFTSPSIVRRYLRLVPHPAPGLQAIAIGNSTAAALREHGWEPAGTAALPTPAGMADAWASALAAAATPSSAPPSSTPFTP